PNGTSSVTVAVVPRTAPLASVHLYWRGSPSGSVEAVPSRVTCAPGGAEHSTWGSGPARAAGGRPMAWKGAKSEKDVTVAQTILWTVSTRLVRSPHASATPSP